MKLRPLVFGSIIALGAAGAAIAQQQPDWDAIQVTAQPIRPGVAVLFGNGGNIGVSYGAHAHESFAGYPTRHVAHSVADLRDWLMQHG